jgi:hypothetical protein
VYAVHRSHAHDAQVSAAHEKFDADGIPTDPSITVSLNSAIESLAAMSRQYAAAAAAAAASAK